MDRGAVLCNNMKTKTDVYKLQVTSSYADMFICTLNSKLQVAKVTRMSQKCNSKKNDILWITISK